MYFPFSFLFFFLLIFGTFLSISSSFWLCVWLGLEINLMSFIPLVLSIGSFQEVEGSIKYFVVQALGSGFFLFGGFLNSFFFSTWSVSIVSSFFLFFLYFGLFIKLGLAPIHFWLVSVMGCLDWFGCLVLSVWQKIAPLFLLFWLFSSSYFFLFCIFSLVSCFVGGLGGLNQVQLRLLMAYSSVNHLGWMISLLFVSFFSLFSYFIIYFLISSFLFVSLWYLGFSRLSGVVSYSNSFIVVFFILFGFLSLAGVPPFFGFVSKWVAIQELIFFDFFYLSFFLILGSIFSLFFYLSVIFNSFFFFSNFSLKSSFFSYFFILLLVLVFIGFFFFDFLFCLFYALIFFY